MIRSFLRGLFKTFYVLLASIGFLILCVGFFLYHKMDSNHSKIHPLTKDTVLTLTLNGNYEDHPNLSPLNSLLSKQENSIYELTHTLKLASQDSKVKGLIIQLNLPEIGFAQIQELRDSLYAFRQAGKFILFYTDSFGETGPATGLYYLATVSNEIWMQPIGILNSSGLNMEVPFAKGALEKLDVKPIFGQRKEYKSYIETFTRDDFSPESKESLQAILASLNDQIIEGISQGRQLPRHIVQDYIHKNPFLAKEALQYKMIDKLDYRHNLKTAALQKAGKIVEFLPFHKYGQSLPSSVQGQKIALIFGHGAIVQEQNESDALNSDVIGSNTTYTNFKNAIDDKNIKAIVYRVNSPGGSPTASETIASVINLAKERGKPVIISMSDYAASGGYWISLAGTKIVAQPGTLTGSIGVFSGKFVLTGLWDKLGIKWGSIKSGENADMWSANSSFSPAAWDKLNNWLDDIYATFTKKVAESRHLTAEQVEKISRGRVWTGEQALALGLVDQLGGIEQAIILAKQEASLPQNTAVEVYPTQKTIIEKLIALLSGENPHSDISSFILAPFKALRLFLSPFLGLISYTHQDVLEAPIVHVK